MAETTIRQRRLTYLTLSRHEWIDLIQSLANSRDSREICGNSLDGLRSRLAFVKAAPDELVTIAQPPLAWSPIIIGLSVLVLRGLGLMQIAERLRSQMMAQERRIEGPDRTASSSTMRRWEFALPGQLRDRIEVN